ncbi:unnamed protein product [Protopolystoma xenopodis]|uniref:Uncharacterized protein n=1 Tax=Protopolystoma xenopodis TaxID=117903 RepID=A0A448XQ10_9PLAT|nr:unnamed protein product [Protopolystoma xenopodis]
MTWHSKLASSRGHRVSRNSFLTSSKCAAPPSCPASFAFSLVTTLDNSASCRQPWCCRPETRLTITCSHVHLADPLVLSLLFLLLLPHCILSGLVTRWSGDVSLWPRLSRTSQVVILNRPTETGGETT